MKTNESNPSTTESMPSPTATVGSSLAPPSSVDPISNDALSVININDHQFAPLRRHGTVVSFRPDIVVLRGEIDAIASSSSGKFPPYQITETHPPPGGVLPTVDVAAAIASAAEAVPRRRRRRDD